MTTRASAMSIAAAALSRLAQAFEGPADAVGERVARAFFDAWEGDPRESDLVLAMLRAAISHEQAAAQARDFVQARHRAPKPRPSGSDGFFVLFAEEPALAEPREGAFDAPAEGDGFEAAPLWI